MKRIDFKFVGFSMVLIAMLSLITGEAVFAQPEGSQKKSGASAAASQESGTAKDAKTPAVSASQESGTVKDAKTPDVSASQESGTAKDAKTPAVSASQESGTVKDAKIPEVPESEASKPDGTETEHPDKKEPVSAEKSDVPETAEGEKTENAPVSPKTFSVQVNKANVRNEASLNAKINAQLKKGQAVTVIEVKDEWYHIQLDDGEHGWVHRSTLGEKPVKGKDIKPGDSIALTVNGNIRKSPDLTSEILTVLKKGDTVVIKESGEEWYHVQLADGMDGWVHKKLFAKRAAARLYDLEGIRIEKSGKNEEKVYFLYKGPKPPDIFISKAGSPRIICDFPNTRPGKGIEKKTDVKGTLIQTVRTGLHGEAQSDLRVVFDVVPGSEYELEHFLVKKELYLLIVKKR